MKNLTDPRWIKLKGLVLLALGILASALLLVIEPDFKIATLLVIAIWAFCRFYYFAFYVIEHYVDGRYRFSGLGSFVKYLISGRADPAATKEDNQAD